MRLFLPRMCNHGLTNDWQHYAQAGRLQCYCLPSIGNGANVFETVGIKRKIINLCCIGVDQWHIVRRSQGNLRPPGATSTIWTFRIGAHGTHCSVLRNG